MPRGKGKGNLKTFVFSIDADDVKYKDLINYLESIDNGARSYVIRQILNSYIGNQCVIPTNAIPPVVENTPNISENINSGNDNVKDTTVQPQPSKTEKAVLVQGNKGKNRSFVPNKIKTNVENKEEPIPVQKKEDSAKSEISEGMSKLLQNFQ